MLTQIQRDTLLRPIRKDRVKQTQGNSYLEAWDVIAYLTKVFGFEGWDKEIVHLGVIAADHVTWRPKDKQGNLLPEKQGWNVCYRCDMRLVVRDPEGNTVKIIEDASTGAATHQPDLADAHDLAMKSAISGALKRCAKDLGDQFGLGLYDNGSTAPCLGRVVIYEGVRASGDDGSVAGPPEVVTTEPQTQGSSERSGGTAADLAARAGMITEPQRRKIYAMTKEPLVSASDILGRLVEHLSDLSITEAKKVIDVLVDAESRLAAQK